MRYIPIKNCWECPYSSHTGAFTPGGAIDKCTHDKFDDEFIEGKYMGRRRPENGVIPEWCPLGKIENEKINYGIAKKEAKIRASSAVYSNILNTLKENFRKVDFQTVSPAEMLKTVEAVCSYVPSSTALDEACDVSLYDHVKLTAAIANAMYLYFAEQGLSNYRQLCFEQKALELRTKDLFLLVSVDLS